MGFLHFATLFSWVRPNKKTRQKRTKTYRGKRKTGKHPGKRNPGQNDNKQQLLRTTALDLRFVQLLALGRHDLPGKRARVLASAPCKSKQWVFLGKKDRPFSWIQKMALLWSKDGIVLFCFCWGGGRQKDCLLLFGPERCRHLAGISERNLLALTSPPLLCREPQRRSHVWRNRKPS